MTELARFCHSIILVYACQIRATFGGKDRELSGLSGILVSNTIFYKYKYYIKIRGKYIHQLDLQN